MKYFVTPSRPLAETRTTSPGLRAHLSGFAWGFAPDLIRQWRYSSVREELRKPPPVLQCGNRGLNVPGVVRSRRKHERDMRRFKQPDRRARRLSSQAAALGSDAGFARNISRIVLVEQDRATRVIMIGDLIQVSILARSLSPLGDRDLEPVIWVKEDEVLVREDLHALRMKRLATETGVRGEFKKAAFGTSASASTRRRSLMVGAAGAFASASNVAGS
jgi:hypothetical protein